MLLRLLVLAALTMACVAPTVEARAQACAPIVANTLRPGSFTTVEVSTRQLNPGQSFTATCSGLLTRLTLEVRVVQGSLTSDVTVYDGAGRSGPVIGTGQFTPRVGTNTISLTTPAPVSPGRVYTVFFSTTTVGSAYFIREDRGTYTGGELYFGTSTIFGQDMVVTFDFQGPVAPPVTLDAAFATLSTSDPLCLNDGTGLLACRNARATTTASRDVATGDFNGDSSPDLAYAVQGGPAQVCLNDGTGRYTCAAISTTATTANAVAVGDFNGDTIADLALANEGPNNQRCLGDGLGAFTCADIPGSLGTSSDVTVGDLNADGSPDLAFSDASGPNIRCDNDGTGTFACRSIAADVFDSRAILAIPLNFDTLVDLVIANTPRAGFGTGQNRICINQGPPTYDFACSILGFGFASPSNDIVAVDIDGDQDDDVVFANDGANVACLKPTLQCQTLTTGTANSVGVAAANIDGDGDFDLVFANAGLGEDAQACFNNGIGTFTCTTVASGPTQAVAVEDFDLGVVPVELTAFSAVLSGEAARLTWSTASETNNAGFHVEHRASNADVFAALGFVDGAGTTATTQRYAFQTDALVPGTHRFRLRQVDFDGTQELSEQVEVTVAQAEALRVSAVPNPSIARRGFTLRASTQQAAPIRIVLYDVLGRVLRTWEDDPDASGALELRVDGLGAGAYWARVTADDHALTQRVVVVR
ncbi:MAG: T9SS type A sorting domain-containing protein [Bacteroidota bacterium]